MPNFKNSRGRNWTTEELEEFTLLLVHEENCFGANLEKMTLKKLSNNEEISFIKNIFDQKIKTINFIHRNEENVKAKDGTVGRRLSS